MNIKKKTVFITGGSTGMGLLVGKIFLDQGFQVGVCSIENLKEMNFLPSGIEYFQADVTRLDQMNIALSVFAQKYGSLDIVIANAGLNHPKVKWPDFSKGKKVVEVNVLGVLNTFEAALAIMKNQGFGHLAAISSNSGLYGLPGMSFYGASKAFVLRFCETLSIDLKSFGIDVTCLVPGFVKTDFVKNNKHKMPFIMEPEKAAREIYSAIMKKKRVHIFPKPMRLIAGILGRLPKRVYFYLMDKDLLGLTNDQK